MAAGAPCHEEDLALARRVLAGDEEAMETFFARCFTVLCRFALVRVGGDEPLAEELAQATLCRAIDKLAGYRGQAALLTWLCTICQNLIADHFARLGRRPEVSFGERDPSLRAALTAVSAGASGPHEELGRREVARRVRAVLGALPPRYSDALSWKYVQGLSVLEIGRRLALTEKAAESLLSRARRAFRESFTGLARGLGPLAGSAAEEGHHER